MEKNTDQTFINEIAREVKCLPSYHVGGNTHIVEAVKAMRAENERLKEVVDNMAPTVARLVKIMDYAKHKSDCPAIYQDDIECVCGLSDLIRRTTNPKQEGAGDE